MSLQPLPPGGVDGLPMDGIEGPKDGIVVAPEIDLRVDALVPFESGPRSEMLGHFLNRQSLLFLFFFTLHV